MIAFRNRRTADHGRDLFVQYDVYRDNDVVGYVWQYRLDDSKVDWSFTMNADAYDMSACYIGKRTRLSEVREMFTKMPTENRV